MATINRGQAPDTYWSQGWGLIWSEDAGRTFRRVEDGRVVEFFHLPGHAHPMDQMSTGRCCGEHLS